MERFFVETSKFIREFPGWIFARTISSSERHLKAAFDTKRQPLLFGRTLFHHANDPCRVRPNPRGALQISAFLYTDLTVRERHHLETCKWQIARLLSARNNRGRMRISRL